MSASQRNKGATGERQHMSRSLETRLERLEQRHKPAHQYEGRVIVEQGATAAETEQRIADACARQGLRPDHTIARIIVRPQP